MRNASLDSYGKLLVCYNYLVHLLFVNALTHYRLCAVKNVKTSRSLDASESQSPARTIACMLNQPHQTQLHSQLHGQLHSLQLLLQLPSRRQPQSLRLLLQLPNRLHHLLFKLVSLEVVFLRILCLSVMETVTTIRNVKVICNAFKGKFNLSTLPFFISCWHNRISPIICLTFTYNFTFTDLVRK